MLRFKREAEILASLNHPNIAQVFGVAESGDVRALAMEFVEGESPEGPMPLDEAWSIASQIAAALEYAHERGVVHRDLKPANIKVTQDGIVKLLDFGLAKAFTEESEAREVSPEHSPTLTIGATQAGIILGTAAYMSPEQARGKKVDKRADIWAFGALLYELLTGVRPFRGEDIGETLAAVIKQEPDLSCVPARAREMIRSCLEKDPKRRLRDIGDAWRLLSVDRAERSHRWPKIVWIATAALFSMAAITAGWLFHPSPVSHQQILRLKIEPPPGGRFATDAMASGMSISPDGTKLAYVASGTDGINRLWIRTLSEPSLRELPGTEDAQYPFWSPDGNTVAFFNLKTLMRIDANGAALQPITDATTGRGGVWLPDGRIVIGSYGDKLRVVSASGGNAAVLSDDGQTGGGRWPQLLPAGRLMYFSVYPSHQANNAAYIISLSHAGASTLLMNTAQSPIYVPGPGDVDYLLWQRGTALLAQALNRGTLKFSGPVAVLADPVSSGGNEGQIYATASKDGPLIYNSNPRLTQFTWFDRSGRPLGTVGAPGRYHFGPFRISPDGRSIAASLDQPGGAQMGLLEIQRGVFSGLPPSGNNGFPAWAPDSRTVTY